MSITAEKIEQIARIIEPEAFEDGGALRSFAGFEAARNKQRNNALEKANAILSLLQQGEPEGWKETLETIRDKANAAVSHVSRANYRERQIEAHQWVNEAVDAAMLSASPLPPATEQGWRPIETAPKDGTKIITFAPDGGIEVSFYYADTLENGTAYETWRDDGCEPTHWMPLPPAPGAETGERKPGEVLQEALLDLVRLCTRDNIGDLDLRLGGVVADGKNVGDWHLTLKSLATTPPAEGETK